MRFGLFDRFRANHNLALEMVRLRPEVWNELIATNLNGAFYAVSAVLPDMREARSGHLIFISSISGHTPDVSGAAYQASKRGLIGLSHAIRVEENKPVGARFIVRLPRAPAN